jgi:hypothetical protein
MKDLNFGFQQFLGPGFSFPNCQGTAGDIETIDSD